MERLDLNSIALIGILLLLILAMVVASLFPVAEKIFSLIVITFGLKSFNGILFWVIPVGLFIYYTALPSISFLLHDLR